MCKFQLVKMKDQGENIAFQIKEEGHDEFIERHCMDILDQEGKKVGEITGYKLHVEAIEFDMQENNGAESFMSLDALSQLCCNLWNLLDDYPEILGNTDELYFLNRMSFVQPLETIENHEKALQLLEEQMEMIVYSLGSTELEDDFPEYISDGFYDRLEEMLKENLWSYNETYNLFCSLEGLDLEEEDEEDEYQPYRVQDNEDGSSSLIYEREGFTDWTVEVTDMSDESNFEGMFRTAIADGKECEQFTLLSAQYLDAVIAQVRIYKNGDILSCGMVPVNIVVFKRKKRIKIDLLCHVEFGPHGQMSIRMKEEAYS